MCLYNVKKVLLIQSSASKLLLCVIAFSPSDDILKMLDK